MFYRRMDLLRLLRDKAVPLLLGLLGSAVLASGLSLYSAHSQATGLSAPRGPSSIRAGRPLPTTPTSVPADLSVSAPPPLVPARVMEHDEVPLEGTVRHLLRATVPAGATGMLRRQLDRILDEERILHPQVDAVAVYIYEEPVYARFTGRVTALEAAVAHAVWAPGGDFTVQARALSKQDNRTVYTLPSAKPGP